jgi:hypothetical protein
MQAPKQSQLAGPHCGGMLTQWYCGPSCVWYVAQVSAPVQGAQSVTDLHSDAGAHAPV